MTEGTFRDWPLPASPPIEPSPAPPGSGGPTGFSASPPSPPPGGEGGTRGLAGKRTAALVGGVAALALVAGSLGAAIGVSLASNDKADSPAVTNATAPAGGATTTPIPSPSGPATTSSTAPPASGSAAPLTGAPLDVKAILAKVEPSVVDIYASTRRASGEGTGVIISPDGYILTNAHVVDGARRVSVSVAGSTKSLSATVVGADEGNDVALLKVDDASGLPAADLGRSADVKVGDDVVAIGNALGLRGDPTVTRGIVSALNRTVENLTGMIQTDAAINPGNSGGPLVNSAGQVIGINTAVAAGGAQNIGFAIPIDKARALAERLKTGQGPAPVAFLGVSTTETPDGSGGAEVVSLVPGGPAQRAGISVGDLIVTFDGKPVASADSLSGLVQARQPGDTVQVVVERNGASRTISVTLGTKPSN
ncbi:MAG: trypsin-like peptidase domain-containing protein [Actinomycetota bacterium]|jgi:S1-C subfamily serine protease